MQEQSKLLCNNCQVSLQEDDKYCHACGQKNTTGKVAVRDLLSEFIDNYLHLNTKLPRTLFALFFKPGKLTKVYFAGKHQSYLRPIRLFGVSTILFLAFLAISASQQESTSTSYDKMHNKMMRHEGKEALALQIDSALNVVNTENPNDNIDYQIDSFIRPIIDSLKHPEKDSTPLMLFNIGQEGGVIKVSNKELFTKTGKEIADDYEVTDFWQRIALIQGAKVLKDSQSFNSYLLKLMSWMFFLMIPFFAMLLKLVYFRRKRYYVEHLVFTFHTHSFLFLSLLILIIPFTFFKETIERNFNTESTIIMFAWLLGIAIYIFVAMRRFYGQKFGKTFLKYLMLILGYLIMFLIFLALFLIISLLMF